MTASYAACMVLVASIYHLPPQVLPAIQAVEGGTNGAVHRNANGTVDYGVMQVNTIWLEPLSHVTRLPPATVARELTTSPCFNIATAALILRVYLNAAHGDLQTAIGDYHSHTALLNRDYRMKVAAKALKLFGH